MILNAKKLRERERDQIFPAPLKGRIQKLLPGSWKKRNRNKGGERGEARGRTVKEGVGFFPFSHKGKINDLLNVSEIWRNRNGIGRKKKEEDNEEEDRMEEEEKE